MGSAWKDSHQKTVVDALERLGGTIERSNGTCATALVEATGLAPHAVSQALTTLGAKGKIERLIKGRRTYAVILVGYEPPAVEPEVEPEPEPEAASNDIEPDSAEPFDYDAMAHSLLALAVKVANQPHERA